MKPGVMLSDVVGSLLRRPFTERYPYERRDVPERLRGLLLWDPQNCTGCGICAQDCPASAVQVIVLDKATKKFVLAYHVDRCTFCGQCVNSCKQGCLSMAPDRWELAALGREAFMVHYGEANDVRRVLAGEFTPDAAAAAES